MVALFVVLHLFTTITVGQLPSGTRLWLTQCFQFPNFQSFEFNNSSSSNYTLIKSKIYSSSCIDCDWGNVNSTPWTEICDPNSLNERWQIISSSSSSIVSIHSINGNDSCIQLSDKTIYSLTTMQQCDNNNIFQKYMISSNGYIQSVVNKSLCLTLQTASTYPNCSMSPYNSYAYCNQQLPTDQRIDDLLSRMTLTEKIQNLQDGGPGIVRLGIPSNEFHEALHGVWCECGQKYSNNTGCPTSFPHALLLGATFNRSLWKEIGGAISTEARAFANQDIVDLFFWSPDINLFRDPRWGRGQEVPGEDPFLTTQYVMEYSFNMQHGADTKYLKIVSTAKHFADYDQEGTYGIARGNFDANVTIQDQIEYYFPAFRAAVQVGGVQSIMCSYNAVNNIPSCGNDYFLNEIVRKEWGFDGFFVSDCGAIADGAFTRYIDNKYPDDNITIQQYEQSREAIQGGCDVNCGHFYNSYLQKSVENGYITEDDINRASKRLWRRSIELGKLDYNPASYYTTYGPEKIDSKHHRDIALRAAEQGIVLLKNKENILPLPMKNEIKKTIALIGPHANATQDMLSNYHGTNTLVNDNSPYMVILKRDIYNVLYSKGCMDGVGCNDTNGFDDAVNTASVADYVIVFLGITPNCRGVANYFAACEGEGRDRNTTEFPGFQLRLLQEIYNVNKNAILVLINGGGIDISWPKQNIPGIIEAFYPGQFGGDAIANIIFGITAVAGKLPYTLYDESLMISRPSIMDMSLRNNGGITYRYYTGKPVYPFGYGLYYTNFTYKYYNSSKIPEIDTKILADFYRNGYYFSKSQATSFIVEVTNIGKMDSDCIVLGFVTSENDPDAPLIKLFDFQRVFVNVGKSINVTLSITPETISIVNKFGNERIVPGKYNLFLGDYQNNNYIHTNIILTGKEQTIFNLSDINRRYNRTERDSVK